MEKENNMNTNENTNAKENSLTENVFLERLKFYADTPGAKNKYFCWKITSILALQDALRRFFDKGWNIRSAWYEKINQTSGETENHRIDVAAELEQYLNEKTKVKKRSR